MRNATILSQSKFHHSDLLMPIKEVFHTHMRCLLISYPLSRSFLGQSFTNTPLIESAKEESSSTKSYIAASLPRETQPSFSSKCSHASTTVTRPTLCIAISSQRTFCWSRTRNSTKSRSLTSALVSCMTRRGTSMRSWARRITLHLKCSIRTIMRSVTCGLQVSSLTYCSQASLLLQASPTKKS